MIIKINNKTQNTTIKKFIMDKFDLSSSKVGKLIDNGEIKINGKKTTFNYLLKENDIVKLYNFKEPNINYLFLKTKYNIKIFYEDDNIIIINKDRGILCQEDAKEKIETLNNAIKKYLFNKKEWDPKIDNHTPNLCHRLDKYTPGLIIASKNKESSIEINNLIKNHKLTKTYECLVYGTLRDKTKTLKNYIMLNEKTKKMEIDENNLFNKEIITKYQVIETYKNYSRVSVNIVTGKKHQIRVHMAYIGHPLLGDNKYNNINCMNYKYPCLISKEIKFNFPKESFLYYLNEKNFILNNYSFK